MRNGAYSLVKAPTEFPGKKYRGRYCLEHVLVWWQNTGQVPPRGYIIHHKNGNKRDNRFENLETMSPAQHSQIHHPKAQMTLIRCAFCGAEFERESRNIRYRKKHNYKRFFCSKSHQLKEMWAEGSFP